MHNPSESYVPPPGNRALRRGARASAGVLALALLAGPASAQDLTTTTEPEPAPTEPAPAFAQDPTTPTEPEPVPTATTEGVSASAQDPTTAPEPEPLPTAPTEAERDYQAIYGGQYDPVADPNLPPPAAMGSAYDPWERYNRQVHRFNNVVDRTVALPLARLYMRVVPRPLRLGVSNFFSNLGQPVSAVNALLQGKPRQAAESLGRFTLNSTLGIGGIFDPASDAKMANRSEDFGQTMGVWGWERSRYLELPLFGPRTVRDGLGMFGDAPLSPLRQVGDDAVRIPLQGLQLVDVRTQLMSTDSLRAGAEDDYALVRDAWSQRRNYQIFGDRLDSGEEGLPEYLLDDSIPQVPAGAMPVLPTDGY